MIEVYQAETRGEKRGFGVTVQGNSSVYANSSSRLIEVNQPVPKSFLSAIADYESGRVVDLDQALNQPPPSKNA
jgi:hypothetical protein